MTPKLEDTNSAIAVAEPTEEERRTFFEAISKGSQQPMVLALVQPYSDSFVQAKENVPTSFQSLYKPEHFSRSYEELLTLVLDLPREVVTPSMAANVEVLTRHQSKSQEWFRYRAGRITASRYRQVLHTYIQKPSFSLLKAVCYPESFSFKVPATLWGCQHEQDAIQQYKSQAISHTDISITSCGFHICLTHPFLGASPDALVQCECCGQGVVEVKCPYCGRDKTILETSEMQPRFCLETIGDQQRLKTDHTYYWQCQLQMLCTGRSYCDFVVWTNADIHVERIGYDKALVESTIPDVKEFHTKCILPELLGKWFSRLHAAQ